MTTSLTGVTVDTGAPAFTARALSSPLIATAGNDSQAIARQQLPSAVPAPALLAAYSSGIAPQPKPPAKPLGSNPSSSFAAQFIAQGAGTPDDLALFTPPPAPRASASPADDYLNDLRIARGDFSAVGQPAPTAPEDDAEQTAASTADGADDPAARHGLGQAAVVFPGLLAPFVRRATIQQTRGVGAYQLAAARVIAPRLAATPVAEPAG